MTRAQKSIVIILTIVIALTRLFAVAHSLFDWDEALFALGVRDYNVMDHHPHPPGYPLFIAAAKAFHFLGISEFRALQVVVVLGAMCLFPALFFLAREIGFDFATSVGGAAVFAFLPNVWVYGGTGFSDVPATAIGFIACALLLRGRRNTRAYLLGAILLGIAAGFRPTNLLLGLVPAVISTLSLAKRGIIGGTATNGSSSAVPPVTPRSARGELWKRVRLITAAILLGGAIAAGSYAGAALASGSFEGYAGAVRGQSQWVRDVDSYHNPHRAPLSHLTKVFFVWPVKQRQQMVGLTLLALISLIAGIVKRRREPLLTLAIFAPFAIMAWLNLDFDTASRYAIPYMATHALLAADALGLFARRRADVQAVLCVLAAGVFAVWTWPALRLQRTADSPPVAALEWIRRNVPPSEKVYIHGGIGPQAQVIVGDRPNTIYYNDPNEISLLSGEAWMLDLRPLPDGQTFLWPRRNSLWRIVRARCFETSVGRATSRIQFGDGWYGEEGTFRWMKGESVSLLPAVRGRGTLRLKIYVPVDTLALPPMLEVRMNGTTIERFAGASAEIEKTWTVPSRTDAPNELRILTSATVNPLRLGRSHDGRDLGLRIDALSWSPPQ